MRCIFTPKVFFILATIAGLFLTSIPTILISFFDASSRDEPIYNTDQCHHNAIPKLVKEFNGKSKFKYGNLRKLGNGRRHYAYLGERLEDGKQVVLRFPSNITAIGKRIPTTVLQKLEHISSINRFIEHYEMPCWKEYIIQVMEYDPCYKVSLRHVLPKRSDRHKADENRIRRIFRKIVVIFGDFLRANLFYDDLKMDHILVDKCNDKDNIMLIDYDHTQDTPSNIIERMIWQKAPELLRSGEANSSHASVWLLGQLFIKMYAHPNKRIRKVHLRKLVSPISKECLDLMLALVQPDPKLRIKFNDVLNHPCLQLTDD